MQYPQQGYLELVLLHSEPTITQGTQHCMHYTRLEQSKNHNLRMQHGAPCH